MASSISRHTSTVSLISHTSSQLESNLFVQCLNKHKELLEAACDKILDVCCTSAISESRAPSPGSAVELELKARSSLAQHLIELLASIVLPDPPQSIAAVDARLSEGRLCVPDKIVPSDVELAVFRIQAEKGRKKNLHLPVDKVYSAAKESNARLTESTCIYIIAVVEKIISKFLNHAICYEEQAQTGSVIRASTVQTLFQLYRDRYRGRQKLPEPRLTNNVPQNYDKCVDELVSFLSSSLEQMNLILRIFREPVLSFIGSQSESLIRKVFDDILDLYNNFRLLLDCLEADTTEDYSLAFKDPSRAFQTAPASPIRPPSAQAVASNSTVSSTCSSPIPDQVRHDTLPSTSLSSSTDFFQLDAQPASTIESSSLRAEKRRGRLVGRLLAEPAEDLSMGSFMDYLSIVLDPECFTSAWKIGEQQDVIEALERLSRTVVHTVARLKPSFVCMNPSGLDTLSSDLRCLCLHSLCCPTCKSLDHSKTGSSMSASSSTSLSSDALAGNIQSPFSPHPNSGQQSAACNYLVSCFRYLLPRLLLLPIFQFFHLYDLVDTLHQCAYDQTDREFLAEVVDVLNGTRVRLKSRLARHSGLTLQFVRLISTSHVCGGGSFWGVGLRNNFAASSSLPPPHISRGHSFSGSLAGRPSAPSSSTSAAPSTANECVDQHLFFACGSRMAVMAPADICNFEALTTTPSDLQIGSVLAMGPKKAEEIDKLTGGKERQFFSPIAWERGVQGLGNFVMEGRMLVREDGKRSALERYIYLFTNFLLICKRTEKRSNLVPPYSTPSSGSGLPVLRLKRRLSLESIHVIDSSSSPLQPRPESFTCFDGPDYFSSGSSVQKLSSGIEGSQFLLEVWSISSAATTAASNSAATSSEIGGSGVGGGFLSFENSLLGGGGGSDEPYFLASGLHVQRIWFEAQNPEEKTDWVSSLLSIETSRIFYCYLRTLPKLEIPLRLPPPDKYRFTQPDTPNLIIFEQLSPPPVLPISTSSRRQNSACNSPRIRSILYTIDSTECDICDVGNINPPVDVVELEDDVEDIFQLPEELSSLRGGNETEVGDSRSEDKREEASSLSPSAVHSTVQPSSPLSLQSFSIPQIQFATVEKLIERLTYPAYSDVAGLNAFLLTFRRFVSTEALLDLLIERFNVPDPCFTPEECVVDPNKLESSAEHMLRRFRSGYKRRVQARVIMFLSRWVRSPRYFAFDFLPNPELRSQLSAFLVNIRTRFLLPTVQAIGELLARTSTGAGGQYNYLPLSLPFDHIDNSLHTLRPTDGEATSALEHCIPSPTFTAGAANTSSSPSYSPVNSDGGLRSIDLLSIHPLELAEQVTLHEFNLYRRIKFNEVDGRTLSSQNSPNLDAYKDFSNKFRDWLVYSILLERNQDDRILAIQRIIDLMSIFEHHRNLQGSQETKAALFSAAVFRLKKAFELAGRLHPYRELVQRLRREGSGGSGKPRQGHSRGRGSSAGGAPSNTSVSLFSLGVLHANSSSSGSSGGGACSSKLISFPLTSGDSSDGAVGSCSTLVAGQNTSGGRSASMISDSYTGGFLQSRELRSGRSNSRRGRGVSASPALVPHCGSEAKAPTYLASSNQLACVPFIAMGVMTPLIHLELRHQDAITTTDGENTTTLINFAKYRRINEIVEGFLCHQHMSYTFSPDLQLQQALWKLDPFALAGVTSEKDFEFEMYHLSESYEPREPIDTGDALLKPHPVEVERRLTKEAIQAGSYLTSLALKDKLNPASINTFRSILRNQKVGRISPRVSCSPGRVFHPAVDQDDRSLVACIWQTRLQQNRAHKATSATTTPATGFGNSQSRAFFSPSLHDTTIHQHSNSDSQMEKYHCSTDDRIFSSNDLDPQLTSSGDWMSVQQPPPLPPRQSAGSSSSGTHCTSVSHSPSPLFHPEAMREESLLPPLPPKPGCRPPKGAHPAITSFPVSPLFHNLNTTAQTTSSTSSLFHEPKLIFEIDPPPLPPRQKV